MESGVVLTVNHLLGTIGVLIVVGVISAKLAERVKIPDVVFFLLAGIVIGPSVLNLINFPGNSVANQMTLVFGSAVILLDGGLSLDLQVLKQTWKTIVVLATVGVLVTAVITAYAVRFSLRIPLVSALLLAAVIASTDPATLIPIFKQVKIRERVFQTVLSEAALNDATGAILTFTLLLVLGSGAFSITKSVLAFFAMAGGGLLVGVIVGLIVVHLIAHHKVGVFAPYSAVMIIIAVISDYVVAGLIGGSGFMAVFVTGIIVGNMNSFKLKHHEAYALEQHHFISNLSLIMRMLIFILLGTQVNFMDLGRYWSKGFMVIIIFMLVARPTTVLMATSLDRRAGWQPNELIFMCWVRETGVMPAALSGILIGMKIPYADVITSTTFMVILATILIQASTTKLFARKLGLLEENVTSTV